MSFDLQKRRYDLSVEVVGRMGGVGLGSIGIWVAGNMPELFMDVADALGDRHFRGRGSSPVFVAGILSVLGLSITVARNKRVAIAERAEFTGKSFTPSKAWWEVDGPYHPSMQQAHRRVKDTWLANFQDIERIGGEWPNGLRRFLVEQRALSTSEPELDTSVILDKIRVNGPESMFPIPVPPVFMPEIVASAVVTTTQEMNPAVDSW